MDIKAVEGTDFYIKDGYIDMKTDDPSRASSELFSIPEDYNYMMIEANPGYAVNMHEVNPSDSSARNIMSWVNSTYIMKVDHNKQYVIQGAMRDTTSTVSLPADGSIAKLYLYKEKPNQFMCQSDDTLDQPQLELIYTGDAPSQGLATDGNNILICKPRDGMDLIDIETRKIKLHVDYQRDLYGHMNDATYYDGAYYVASMNSKTGEVFKFDSQTLELLDTIILKNENDKPYTVWRLAYDQSTNRFYSAYDVDSPETYLIYDTEFNLVDKVQLSGSTTIDGNEKSKTLRQSFDVDNEYIYECNISKDLKWAFIGIHKKNGKFACVLHLDELTGKELEGIAYDWNHDIMYISCYMKQGGQKKYQVFRMTYKSQTL